MSHPIELSDELVRDAEQSASQASRSVGAQIELWAKWGRAVEPLLEGTRGGAVQQEADLAAVLDRLANIHSADGHQRLADYLTTRPFPHYTPAPDRPGLLIRTAADGTQTLGRFVGREFETVE